MAEGEGGYKPPEADVKPQPEKKRSFRDLFKYVVKNWPTTEKYYIKMEEKFERDRLEREQRSNNPQKDNPPKNSTS